MCEHDMQRQGFDVCIKSDIVTTRAGNEAAAKFPQSRRRPLLVPSPGSHLRQY